jgi:ABC-type multidrug transport system ATPase subunit
MNSAIVQVSKLSKQYNGFRAVDDLSFIVREGEIYGFLGQNGAGKSTTIRMLLTLIQPTTGSIQIFGKELQSNRRVILQQVGAIIERPDLYNYLTAFQNLHIMARLSGCAVTKKQVMDQLGMVGLAGRWNSKVKTFSQGMKQRLGIACALIHDPRLLILDEPTNGLDPQGIADIRNLVLHLTRNEGKTIVISSHLLNEIELVADSMLIIDKGKKIAEGKVSELLNPADILVEVSTTNNNLALVELKQTGWNQYLQPSESRILLRLHQKQIPQLTRDMVGMGIDILSLQWKHSLEEYFLSLTTENRNA